jgi:tetraprenyl-beta-curcumene synthase
LQRTTQSSGLPRGPISLMYRMYRYILPGVRSELHKWRKLAERIPDPELKRQAIASMTTKEFHCLGGAVYASGSIAQRQHLLRLITAFQTISDYLDNLCDRSTSLSAEDFRALHQAMLDAVNPHREMHDYYVHRKETEDGGYLRSLVGACRELTRQLPSYSVVQPLISDLVSLYCDLQVYKHIHPELREQALLDWWEQHRHRCPDLKWNEFAAACGSTLGVFMLFQAAGSSGLTEGEAWAIYEAYFPYICALHILLDYLIDQEEDERGGDLNFCAYYTSPGLTVDRLQHIAEQARMAGSRLPGARFHLMIIEGLLALYLSDPKVSGQETVTRITRELMHNSPWTRLFFWLNSKWIRAQ